MEPVPHRTLVVTGMLALLLWACGSSRMQSTPTDSSPISSAGSHPGPGSGSGGMSIDLGSVMQAGTTSGGATGGAPPKPETCDDTCLAIGKCEEKKCVIFENPGQLTPDQQQLLRESGTSDDSFRWLYPYDATVFPRGLRPPVLQFGGIGADALFLHISFDGLDYQGFFGASDPARIQLSEAAWTAITRTADGADAVKVEATKLQAGKVTGPISETWTIASGSLRGALYYQGGGDLWRLRPGDESDELVIPGGCCVSVSADGSKLAASLPTGYRTYDLRSNFSLLKEWPASGNPGVTAFYPDGSRLLVFTTGGAAQLVDPLTGAPLPQSGWPSMITTQAGSFAPDGTKLVYFDQLSVFTVLDFDRATNTFSGRKDFQVAQVSPVHFTPDTASVIFSGGIAPVTRLDLQSGESTALEALAGVEGEERPRNDGIALLPLSVGGYYWVVFSSDRAYGNMTKPREREVLWVAALDMSAANGDSSHPAFYLDGPDPARGNMFSQWALEPCQGDGNACEFGDQCCGGYCREMSGRKQCLSTPPNSCAYELEHCDAAADCCDKTYKCINSRCAAPKPVVK